MKRLVLALSVVALGCTPPTAPSSLLEGILVYEHPRFGGQWKVLTSDWPAFTLTQHGHGT